MGQGRTYRDYSGGAALPGHKGGRLYNWFLSCLAAPSTDPPPWMISARAAHIRSGRSWVMMLRPKTIPFAPASIAPAHARSASTVSSFAGPPRHSTGTYHADVTCWEYPSDGPTKCTFMKSGAHSAPIRATFARF